MRYVIRAYLLALTFFLDALSNDVSGARIPFRRPDDDRKCRTQRHRRRIGLTGCLRCLDATTDRGRLRRPNRTTAMLSSLQLLRGLPGSRQAGFGVRHQHAA